MFGLNRYHPQFFCLIKDNLTSIGILWTPFVAKKFSHSQDNNNLKCYLKIMTIFYGNLYWNTFNHCLLKICNQVPFVATLPYLT